MSERRPDLRVESGDRAPGPDGPEFRPINRLPRLATHLRALTRNGGAVPADSRHVEAAIRSETGEELDVRPEELEALVALGTLRRVIIGSTPHLVWASDPTEGGEVSRAATSASGTPGETESEADLRFRLEVALDVERERLLLYRVVLVLEVLAAGLLVRYLLLEFLGS